MKGIANFIVKEIRSFDNYYYSFITRIDYNICTPLQHEKHIQSMKILLDIMIMGKVIISLCFLFL